MKPETRLQRALAQARHALEALPEPRPPGLGDPDFPTRRATLVPDFSPTLFHPNGRRGLPDLVDSSSAKAVARLQAVGRELARGGAAALLERLRARGDERRAQLLDDT